MLKQPRSIEINIKWHKLTKDNSVDLVLNIHLSRYVSAPRADLPTDRREEMGMDVADVASLYTLQNR